MTPSRHRGSPLWIGVFAACVIVFGAFAGYGFSCASATSEVCLSLWGRAAGTVAVYGCMFAGLALVSLVCLSLLLSGELVLRDDGLSLRYALWRRDYRVNQLQDFVFLNMSHIRMYRVRLVGSKKTLYLASMFNRFDVVEQWLTQHVKPLQ